MKTTGLIRVVICTRISESTPMGASACLLSDPIGELVAAYQFFPNQVLGYTYGLAMDGTTEGLQRDVRHFFPTPTPGEPNVSGAPGVSAAPVFSEPAGAYPAGLMIDLSVEVPVEGTEIRYTTNDSVPTLDSSLYNDAEPISILTELIITARAFQPGLLPSEPVSSYYIILDAEVLEFDSTVPLVICSTLGRSIPLRCGRGDLHPWKDSGVQHDGGSGAFAG